MALITNNLRKGQFKWGEDLENNFKFIKHKLSYAPFLALPDLNKMFKVKTNVSMVFIGVILFQSGKSIEFSGKS